jgi:uncharacterized protein (DUF2249 family)
MTRSFSVGNADASESELLVHPPNAPVVEVDVREDLRSGREPFAKIVKAVDAMAADEVLHLRAIFEPVPLYAALSERGLEHEAHAHATDDWSVWFWKPVVAPVPAASSIELDVRPIPVREKHPTIFRAIDGLAPGQALVIVNDHDPRPLRYQLDAERPNAFDWAYEAQGPEAWRVRISRR